MKFPVRINLPYIDDSSILFDKIKELPWSAYLSSGQVNDQTAHYDIITADPYMMLHTYGQFTTIHQASKQQKTTANPWQLLKTYLTPVSTAVSDVPFCGGALGFFSYDLAYASEKILCRIKQSQMVPDMLIGLYDWSIILDHQQQQCYLASCYRHPQTSKTIEKVMGLLNKPIKKTAGSTFRLTSGFRSNITFEQYSRSFKKIKDYIAQGDCYQVNLSQQFKAGYCGELSHAFHRLMQHNPMPFSAFLNFDNQTIISCSPERFLKVRDQHVLTQPIKGTRPRNVDPQQDQQLAQELLKSPKDQAENLMIVDLLRHDLSKNCKKNSVKVPKLFHLHSFPGVHHLVSSIVGIIEQGKHALDVLQACFPGGSITGAPKIRAMQVIDELEPHQRGVYCGCIGYIGFDGHLDMNIAIRTLFCCDQQIICHSGGAIVADSVLEEEYQESLDKISRIRCALGERSS